MSKAAKVWLIIAGCCVVTGIIIFTAFAASGFDFRNIKAQECITNEYSFKERFNGIDINVDTTEIILAASTDKECKVVCTETEKNKHTVEIEDRILKISSHDNEEWYERLFNFGVNKMSVTVYLPEKEYEFLTVYDHTGDVTVPTGFTFEIMGIMSDTSDVNCSADVKGAALIALSTGDLNLTGAKAGELKITATTGDVDICSTEVKGNTEIKTTTGNQRINGLTCSELSAESSTGNYKLSGLIASGKLELRSTTGNIELDGCDGKDITIKTTTGNVNGSLLSEKVFSTESATGNISVPKTASGGKCEITTTTGNINIDIKK